jgi:hypothetical protein
MRSRPTLALLAAAAGLALPVAAQAPADGTAALSRESIQTQKRFIIGGSLPLEAGEAERFWPLYEEYQRELAPVGERWARLVSDFARSYRTLTDTQAQAMMNEAIAVDEQQLALRKKYLKRMAGVLPPRKLALYFQLESKLDAVVRYDIARTLPLLQ